MHPRVEGLMSAASPPPSQLQPVHHELQERSGGSQEAEKLAGEGAARQEGQMTQTWVTRYSNLLSSALRARVNSLHSASEWSIQCT